MSATTRWLLGVVIGVSLCILIYRYTLGPGRLMSRAAVAKNLATASAELNRRLPIMVDSMTELESTIAMDSVLQYNMRLTSMTITQEQATALRNIVRPEITRLACSKPDTRTTFLKRGVSLRYSYTDRNGYDLFTINVAPRDCGF
jgi:hypothetical protein